MRAWWTALTLAAAAATIGCGNATAPNPFGGDAGPDAAPDGGTGGGGGGAGGVGGGESDGGVDPTLGGPCLDDGQCDDMIDCTFDACDLSLGRCRFTPDDSKCQDGVYCDGVERCDNKKGCVPGDPVDCGDNDSCTIDTCVESTHGCTHAPRDADGDGDPDWHCPGGHDCDDEDPNISSLHPEVCENGIDDNCNGMIDETPCVSPKNDTCLDPLTVSASGTYAMSTVGCKLDYPTTCGLGVNPSAADAVAAVILPAGPPADIEVRAATIGYQVSATIAGQCGDPSTELACGATFYAPMGGSFAKVRARGVGSASQMSAYPVYVATAPGTDVALDVQILPGTTKATNETCGTAATITPGVPITTEIIDAAVDLASACPYQLGELVWSFDVLATSDVDVFASSAEGDGNPVISLRDPGCALPGDELACQAGAAPHIFRHALPPGTYYVAVSASAPTDVELTVDLSAPTVPSPDQTCTGSPVMAPNVTIPVMLSTHEDDVNLGCNPGAVDAAYELDLAAASDVLLVERIAQGDTGSVALSAPACTPQTTLVCQESGGSPVRAAKHNVPAGAYRVVAQSLLAEDVELTAFVRDAVPPTLVAFAGGCGEVFPIPATGGFFQGNTANATPHFGSGCDEGGVQGAGANDQLLSLTLTAPQRVVFDMAGSGYNTILDIRQGPGCPGTEVPMACAVGFPPQGSYLDVELGAGTYYIQIDGFELAAGPWFLDVRVVAP